jgi:Zn finger protein HypA/HybF involved in hydrogenase expression
MNKIVMYCICGFLEEVNDIDLENHIEMRCPKCGDTMFHLDKKRAFETLEEICPKSQIEIM